MNQSETTEINYLEIFSPSIGVTEKVEKRNVFNNYGEAVKYRDLRVQSYLSSLRKEVRRSAEIVTENKTKDIIVQTIADDGRHCSMRFIITSSNK